MKYKYRPEYNDDDDSGYEVHDLSSNDIFLLAVFLSVTLDVHVCD